MVKINYDNWDAPEYEEPQPKATPKKAVTPLIATRSCVVEFDDCTVELVEGQEVHGLKRQEREHLLFHGFVE